MHQWQYQPTITSNTLLTTEAEVHTLTAGNTTTYKPRNLIPVVPFLLETTNDAIQGHDRAASIVLFNVVQEVKAFDTRNASKNKYQEKAKQKCKDLMLWLYLIATGNAVIKATPMTGCNNMEIMLWRL